MRVRPALGLACLLAASSHLAVPTASAQSGAELDSGGLDLRLFRPGLDTKGHFAVNGTDILGHNQFSFGLVLDAGGGILPFRGYENSGTTAAADASRTSDLISTQVAGTLLLNYGIVNRLVVGVSLPITFVRGPRVEIPGFYNTGSSVRGLTTQGLGDLGLNLKLRILRSESDPVGLAVILRATFPTGSDVGLTGESGITLWPSAVVEYRHNRFRMSFEAGYRQPLAEGATDVPVNGRTCPSHLGPMCDTSIAAGSAESAQLVDDGTAISSGGLLTFGLGASVHVGQTVDLVAETYGSQLATQFGDDHTFSMEALGGVKVYINGNNYLMLAGGAGIPVDDGFQQANWRGVLGFAFEPSIQDADGDGLRDDEDQCPNDPEDFDDFEDSDGCPEPDNDRDGILDVDDECVDVPEDRDGNDDQDGCPEGGDTDRDRDGIPDVRDNCPDDPEDRDDFEDENGCPDPDNDRDGFLDAVDRCPNEPEDYDGFQDDDGCPDPDNDQDHILDEVDRCPNEPETRNGHEDEDGCPDRGLVLLEENQILILEKIYFETNSAVIMRRSLPVIDAVAATLLGNPQIRRLEVQGHADERGNDDYNLRLTRDRAAAVVEALVQRGVPRERVQSAGYGELCPINPGHNGEAWDANRRVEFTIIENEFGPTGVLGGCEAAAHLRPR